MNKAVVDLPVATGQWQIKQPLLSIDTQFKSHEDASNDGQPPTLCPPPLPPDGASVVPLEP